MSKLAKALQAAAGAAGGESIYVDDVFSTYLYTGTGSNLNIVNGLDNSGEGGMVWLKRRDGATAHTLYDTERGTSKYLIPSESGGEGTISGVTAFNSDGFTLGTYASASGQDWVSWNWRKQAGLFDVVTYTGDNSSNRQISHNLGCVPAMILIKRTDFGDDWIVYHVGMDSTAPEDYYMVLNDSAARTNSASHFNDTAPTSTNFTIGSSGQVNQGSASFVAYLFAGTGDSDSQIFGDGSDESIIKCGSYTGNGSTDGPEIDLGFEPQWVLIKNADIVQNWYIVDNMRGMAVNVTDGDATLIPNTSGSENTGNIISPLPNGFKITASNSQYNGSGNNIVYIAIRRPMKTPESGTEVFSPETYTGNGSTQSITGLGFSPDLVIPKWRSNGGGGYSSRPGALYDRLRGATIELSPTGTSAESTQSNGLTSFDQDGFSLGSSSIINSSPDPYISWNFKRATGFFDVVAYTGDGVSGRNITHNLGVTPELMIVKARNSAQNWVTYDADTGATKYMRLNTNGQPATTSGMWNNTAPTATVFTVDGTGGRAEVNASGTNYIAYLFASVAGVSKIGVYTGTGSNVNVDCGFSAGARFILIKRNSDSGEWYVYDSTRGIVAGNDPYLLLNSTAAEVTNTDYIDPLNAGFTVTSSAPLDLNTSGHTYIFLAIA